ncbi:MAG: hydrogenase maturation protease [Thermodesulfobacteriota bacterium]|nr:hydrogenase maturation protease [Thermodesulfobacteriota bacterium]
MSTEIYRKKILIFGCGNTLFENDGFGPAVIEFLKENYELPDSVLALDAGTGIKDFMFDLLLMEDKPDKLFVIDAVTVPGRKTGEVFEIDLADVPPEKMSDFSLHQSPSSNLLKELKDLGGVDVRVLGVHVNSIPNEINPGLTREIKDAVPQAALWIMEQLKDIEKKR